VLLGAAASAQRSWREAQYGAHSVGRHSPWGIAPWRTTKRGVKLSSAVGRRLRGRASRGNLTIGSSDHAEAVDESREDPMSKAISDRQSVSPPRVAQPDR
jgi:hypothetical protein